MAIMILFRSTQFIRGLLFILTVMLIMTPGSECFCTNAQGAQYSVQVASYINATTATAQIAGLKAKGYPFFCRAVNIPGQGRWYRVVTGTYQNRNAAIAAGMALKKKGLIQNFVIIKTSPGDITGGSEKNKPVIAGPVVSAYRETGPVPAAEKAKTASPDNRTPVAPSSPVTPAKKIVQPPVPLVPPPKKIVSPDQKITAPVTQVVPKNQAAVVLTPDGKNDDSAMRDFIAQRYEDALPKFEKLAATGNRENALRRMADCYYFLGRKGNKQYLLKSIDLYRKNIKQNPDALRENAQARYRLADGYRHLNFFYEALAEFDNLCLQHPESIYAPDALFMTGKMNYRIQRFDRALEKFKVYIKKYPDGRYDKAVYLAVADCYSRLHQFDDANFWYANALKKLPGLENIPEESLSQLGATYYFTRKYDDALAVFMVYLNLFPEGRAYKDTLVKMARIFEKKGQLPMALNLLSLILERYPDTREARQSALLMADIGLDNPTLELPRAIFTGKQYYHDPISTYEEMAKENIDPGMAEELAFRKGTAQLKKGQYRQALDTCRLLLDRFPTGDHRKAVTENYLSSAGHLLDELYAKKDPIAVVQFYFNANEEILLNAGDFDMLSKIALCLKKTGLNEQAIAVFKKIYERFPTADRINEVRLAEAHIDYDMGRHEKAREILKTLLTKSSGPDKKTVETARRLMGDICFNEQAFKEASGYYLETMAAGETTANDMAAVRKKYADALKEMGRYAEALANYQIVLKNGADDSHKYPDAVMMDSYEGAGDCLYACKSIQAAISMYEKAMQYKPLEAGRQKFMLFKIGRCYARIDDTAMAEKAFGPLKEDTDDDFWSTLADNYLTHKNWTEKYGKYL